MAPDNPAGLNDLAWLCATHPSAEVRNGAEAVRLAERACQLTRRKAAPFLDTLAAAYAEAGRFAEAVRTAREAQTLALAADDSKTAAGAAERIEWYKTARPWRDPATPK